MSNVPSNLIPTRITQLPDAPVASEDSLMLIVYGGVSYKIRVGDLLSVSGVPTSRQVIAGTGLSGGGALSNNVTLSIAAGGVGATQLSTTGVAAGTYGSASLIPVMTVDATGRVTSAVNVTPSISNLAGGAAFRIAYQTAPNVTGFIPAPSASNTVLEWNGTSFVWVPAAVGTISAVTASLPISSSGGTTPNISISQATATTNGYLSSSDWSTFNNKQEGLTLTTVGTSGPATLVGGILNVPNYNPGSAIVTSVTATSPIVSTGGSTPNISMPAANGSTNGYLTSADWTTFNNKVTSVSGTTGRITSTGGATPVIDLANGIVTAGTTGSSTLIPVITVDTYGRVTSITTADNPQGTVTAVSVASANGFAGSSSGGATPQLTLTTTITGLLKGNGTAISAATSGVDYAPATSGTSILYGNNAGGFSNVTIGSGISFSGGTLSATGSGGTVTSVTATAPVVSSGGTTPVISMAAASSSVSGYLTSTDWTTFNNKGNINSVTGTAPVSVTSGDSPVISMAAANSTTNGYLSSTDWTTFNNKGSGSVTSVAALTLGTSGTDLNSTVANSTTTPVITLNVPTASASNRGALSSTDWTTFNSKQDALVNTSNIRSVNGNSLLGSGNVSVGTVTSVTGTAPIVSSGGTTPAISMAAASSTTDGYLTSTDWNTFNSKGSGTVTGSGTTNYVPKFTSSTAIGNSLIYDNGTNVGIGTSSPTSFGSGAVVTEIKGTTGYGALLASTNTVTGQLFANEGGLSVHLGSRTNHPLLLTTSNTERMRIDTSGNVGIGTSSPAAKLHVTNGNSVNAVTSFFTSGASDPNFMAGFANGSGSSVNTEQAKIGLFYSTTIAPVCHIGLLRGGSANSIGMTFNINNTESMRIDSSGNVGIGTTSPNAQFHVSGGGSGSVLGYATNALITQSDDYTFGLVIQNATAGSNFGIINFVADTGATYVGSGDGAGGYQVTSLYDPSSGSLRLFAASYLTFGMTSSEYGRFCQSGGLAVGTSTDTPLGAIRTTGGVIPRAASNANQTSPWAWSSASYDQQAITALANALTINADSGSPVDGQKTTFRIKDNGTGRALTWTTGSTNSFRAIGVTLPTTTVANKTVYIGCIYNAADSRWDVVSVAQEA